MQINTNVLIAYSIISLLSLINLLIGFQMVFLKKRSSQFIGWILIIIGAVTAALLGVAFYYTGWI